MGCCQGGGKGCRHLIGLFLSGMTILTTGLLIWNCYSTYSNPSSSTSTCFKGVFGLHCLKHMCWYMIIHDGLITLKGIYPETITVVYWVLQSQLWKQQWYNNPAYPLNISSALSYQIIVSRLCTLRWRL